MAGTDDLAPLLTPGPERPPYGQATIVAFNPDTFENEVSFRGQILVDVPVKSSVEALTYQPGDTVVLSKWSSSRGGTGSWWIDGRAIIPGPGAAEAAVAWMTTSLGAAVAKSVIGESVFFAEVTSNGDVNYPSGGFVDPDTGDPGPEVSGIEISDSGRAIVTVGAVFAPGTPDSGIVAAYMGFEVSGDSSVSASINRSAKSIVDATGTTFGLGLSQSVLITGLTSGGHTFTAKYNADVVTGTPPSFARWDDRYIQVIAF